MVNGEFHLFNAPPCSLALFFPRHTPSFIGWIFPSSDGGACLSNKFPPPYFAPHLSVRQKGNKIQILEKKRPQTEKK